MYILNPFQQDEFNVFSMKSYETGGMSCVLVGSFPNCN